MNSLSNFWKNPRWARALGWVLLAVILVCEARLRFHWVALPFADPDTWGYLYPAIAKLTGHNFEHTYGRNFVYPGWIYFLLKWFGDFRAITIAQHILGLATGVLLWRVWLRWRDWFVQPRLPELLAVIPGVGMVALFLSSARTVYFEHQLRPEAIFPFFALLGLYLSMEFLRAWFVTRRLKLAAFLGAASLFDAVLVYQLKPSSGLAIGVAGLPLLAACLAPRQTWRRRLIPAAAGATASLASLVLLLAPEKHFARNDKGSTLFLPQILLTIHADIILDQMAQDLRDGNPTLYRTDWLTTLHDKLKRELEIASRLEEKSYASLGFNPDYLYYSANSFCRFLSVEMSPPQIARLCYYYYQRAWLHRPAAMAAKVLRQLHLFYGARCPAYWSGRGFNSAKLYRNSVQAFEPQAYQKRLLVYAPARDYLEKSRLATDTAADFVQPGIVGPLNRIAAVWHLPLLLATVVGVSLVLILMRSPTRWRLAAPGLVVVLLLAYNFANCLTVSIVHSLGPVRYTTNLLIFTVLGQITGLVWCVEAVLCLGATLRATTHRSPQAGQAAGLGPA